MRHVFAFDMLCKEAHMPRHSFRNETPVAQDHTLRRAASWSFLCCSASAAICCSSRSSCALSSAALSGCRTFCKTAEGLWHLDHTRNTPQHNTSYIAVLFPIRCGPQSP